MQIAASHYLKGMYLSYQKLDDEEKVRYHLPYLLKLKDASQVDLSRLQQCYENFIQQHYNLRSQFSIDANGELIQQINENVEAVITSDEYARYSDLIKQGFELENAPLCRLYVLNDLGESYLLFVFHHMVVDGNSVHDLVKSLVDSYEGHNAESVAVGVDGLKKYLECEQSKIQTARDYENSALELHTNELSLPWQHVSAKSFEVLEQTGCFDQDLYKKLIEFSEKEKVSVFNILKASYGVLVARYSQSDEFIIGYPFYTARGHEVEGCFVNTIFDTFKLKQNFKEQIHAQSIDENLKVSRYLPAPEALDRAKSIDAYPSISMTMTDIGHAPSEQWQASPVAVNLGDSDLNFAVQLIDDTVKYQFVYSNKIESPILPRLSVHFVNLLSNLLTDPQADLKRIDYLGHDEKALMLEQFNNTDAMYPKDKQFVELFSDVVNKYPNSNALAFDGDAMTYQELDDASTRLANYLVSQHGAGPEKVVGLLFDPCFEMIISILAVLKSGAAYVPIAVEYPLERRQYMLENSESILLLTHSELQSEMNAVFSNTIALDQFNYSAQSDRLDSRVSLSQNLAYLIYTSGTTGNPKGVMIEHGTLTNLCHWYVDTYELTHPVATTKYAGFGFDASVVEIFPSLMSGCCLHIIPKEMRLNLPSLYDYFKEHKIGSAFLPTQFSEVFMQNPLVDLKHVMVGGDKLKQVNLESPTTLHNGYGPTEATVMTTDFVVDAEYTNIPIGRPLANYKVHILDANLNLCPLGVPGELCIGGLGLARGYLNRQDLTDEKFIQHPEFGRIYRTGDLTRWKEDGNIEFLGRLDFQVKIRGFRIELGEIESRLTDIEQINDSLVLALDDANGNKYLCAYYVSQHQIDEVELQRELSKHVPEYMIPDVFVHMTEFPLTPNGKVDRRGLPEPDKNLLTPEYVAPRNQTESILVNEVATLLNYERVGVADDFFKLGGSSISAVALIGKLSKLGYRVNISDIFKNSKVADLATILDSSTKIEAITKAPELEFYPVTSAQRGIYLTEKLQGPDTTYNLYLSINIEGSLDKEKLGLAIDQLVDRHESLRMCFDYVDGEVVQYVSPQVTVSKKIKKISESEIESNIYDLVQPFDVANGPLISVGLLEIERDRHVLVLNMHHIVVDGLSVQPLMDDLFALYDDKINALPEISYKDYSYWYAQQYLASDSFSENKAYWKHQLDGASALELPYERAKTASNALDRNNETARVDIPSDLAKRVEGFCQQHSLTPYMFFVGVYGLVLSKYARNNDVVFGAAASGRLDSSVENMVGMFVNTLPLRLSAENDSSFSHYFSSVKENCLGLLKHQGYNFEQIIQELGSDYSTLVDVFFNYFESEPSHHTGGLKYQVTTPDPKVAKFDLTMMVNKIAGRYVLSADYRSALFGQDMVIRLMNHFLQAVDVVINSDYAEDQLSRISLITSPEKKQIIEVFNDTAQAYPNTKTPIALFEESVQKNPNTTAVIFESVKLTYAELDKKANQLAHYLIEDGGVTPGSKVGVLVDRSVEMIVSILAILKAGSAYIPLSKEYPQDRIAYILEDSQSSHLIVSDNFVDQLGPVATSSQHQLVNIDQINYQHHSTSPTAIVPSIDDVMYVIYTSGTTGNPKGVEINSGTVTNLASGQINKFGVTDDEVILQFSEISFDASVEQIWIAFVRGCSLLLIRKDKLLDAADFEQYLVEHKATHVHAVPAFLNSIDMNEKSHLKRVIAGGDACTVELAKKFVGSCDFINEYGPTETTVTAIQYHIPKGTELTAMSSLPIGKPLTNYKAYILDENLNLCPIGVPGELCIGGECLARGYLNRPELNAEKFIYHPELGEYIYRSGDLARLKSDGNIDFLGRIDFQVKVRGFRIELGEIESRIIEFPSVTDALVLALDDEQGMKYLCGYYVSSTEFTDSDLTGELKKHLPEYMIPSAFVRMDTFPLTPNGKVNRKAMPKPEITFESEFIEPRDLVEEKLCKLWEKTLGLARVGICDDFFRIGGNSIKAIGFISEAKKQGLNLKINDLFKNPTIKQISENVDIQAFDLNSNLDQIKLNLTRPPSDELKRQVELESNKAVARSQTWMDKLEEKDLAEKVNGDCVLVTGATGHLGAHIVFDLLTQGKEVIALVRGKNDSHARERLEEKLEYYFGDDYKKFQNKLQAFSSDLEEADLGLGQDCYQSLISRLDAIIHSAANVSHYGEYEVFYRTNVLSTENLIALAEKGSQVGLHYISTRSVCEGINIKGREVAAYAECDTPNVEDSIDNVYLKTKLLGEHRVIDARERGLRASIYRVGNLAFNSQTLTHQSNLESNGFYKTLKSFFNMGMIFDGYQVEMSCVDKTAEAICKIFDRKALQSGTYHVYNPNKVKYAEIFTAEDNPLAIDVVSVSEYIDSLKERAESELFKGYVEDQLLHLGWSEKQSKESTQPIVIQGITNKALAMLGFDWGQLTAVHLVDMMKNALKSRIDYLSSHSLFEKLDEKMLTRLALKSTLSSYSGDKRAAFESDSRELSVVYSGFASLSLASPGGWEGTVRILSESSLVNTGSLLTSTISSKGHLDSLVGEFGLLKIDQQLVKDVLAKEPEFLMSLLESISDERDAYRKMLVMTH
ncbi:amino acid adenylation domain-containing protein [Vibrio profundum]|uniref:non-ribosomal peptide synthetase n=1 Tax=Vibrio profundum TaxID=2910247 RepID=UPI003D0CEDA0